MHCHPLDSDILPNRLANYIQPLIASVLSQASGVSKSNDQVRKGKKRNRNFEGEEILKGAREALCQTPEDERVLLKSLEGIIHYLLLLNMGDHTHFSLHLSLAKSELVNTNTVDTGS